MEILVSVASSTGQGRLYGLAAGEATRDSLANMGLVQPMVEADKQNLLNLLLLCVDVDLKDHSSHMARVSRCFRQQPDCHAPEALLAFSHRRKTGSSRSATRGMTLRNRRQAPICLQENISCSFFTLFKNSPECLPHRIGFFPRLCLVMVWVIAIRRKPKSRAPEDFVWTVLAVLDASLRGHHGKPI